MDAQPFEPCLACGEPVHDARWIGKEWEGTGASPRPRPSSVRSAAGQLGSERDWRDAPMALPITCRHGVCQAAEIVIGRLSRPRSVLL